MRCPVTRLQTTAVRRRVCSSLEHVPPPGPTCIWRLCLLPEIRLYTDDVPDSSLPLTTQIMQIAPRTRRLVAFIVKRLGSDLHTACAQWCNLIRRPVCCYNETEYLPRCNSGYPAPSLARAGYQAIPGIVSGRVVAHATGIHANGPRAQYAPAPHPRGLKLLVIWGPPSIEVTAATPCCDAIASTYSCRNGERTVNAQEDAAKAKYDIYD